MEFLPTSVQQELDAVLTELAGLASWMLNEEIRRFRVGDAGCCHWWFLDGQCPEWAASWSWPMEEDAFFCAFRQAPGIVREIWGGLDELLSAASREMLRQQYPQYDEYQWTHGVFLDSIDFTALPGGWNLQACVWLGVGRECTGYMGTKDLEETEGYVHWRTNGEAWHTEIKATTQVDRNACWQPED